MGNEYTSFENAGEVSAEWPNAPQHLWQFLCSWLIAVTLNIGIALGP